MMEGGLSNLKVIRSRDDPQLTEMVPCDVSDEISYVRDVELSPDLAVSDEPRSFHSHPQHLVLESPELLHLGLPDPHPDWTCIREERPEDPCVQQLPALMSQVVRLV